MARFLVLPLFVLAVDGTDPRIFGRFEHLQVSSPLRVKVTVDENIPMPKLSIKADQQALGWTVDTNLFPATFGPTLFLGMDARAAAQGFSWSGTSGEAHLTVPNALSSISAANGAKVHAEVVTGDLAASDNASVVVTKIDGAKDRVRSHLFRASSGAVIIVSGGQLQRGLLQATGASEVNVENVSIARMEVEVNRSNVTVNATEVAIVCINGSVQLLGNAAVIENNSQGCSFKYGIEPDTESSSVIIP